MSKKKILAHVGLALVTYVPIVFYILFVFIGQPDSVNEVFGSGLPMFLGFFATTMFGMGWPLVLISMFISAWGLFKGDYPWLNGATLACCISWIAAFIWVMANFA